MKRAILALALVAMTSGCLGTGGVGGTVKEWNLSVTENRWGREGVFFVFQVLPVYRICLVLDLVVFNSIEFWTGKNMINGKSPLVDIPPAAAQKIASNEIERAQIEHLSDTAAKLHVDFANGDHLAFDVLRDGESYTVSYLGRVFYEGKVTE